MSLDRDALERVVSEVVAPNATSVDRDGRFPTEALGALRDGGFLGLTVGTDHEGGGGSMADAAVVVEQLAGACGSTAMVVLMHYAATAVLEAYGPADTRSAIGRGEHLTTLAFSEAGSRSHFWAPCGTATAEGDRVRLDADKSWVTSAAAADSYVWSSTPLDADGPMTLWLVPSDAAGLDIGKEFDGLGLRGNGSVPVHAGGVRVAASAQLGDDGKGLDIALEAALPWFLVLSAAFALGLMEAVTSDTLGHATTTKLEHLGSTLISQPLVRSDIARMRITTDSTRAFLADTLAALGEGRADAVLRVLESKAVGAEAAIDVSDRAMKVCGGAAFRKELGVERRFRDARAARVMAPTTDALLDFVARAISGMPLLDA
ncbi:MAG TPA: acyl-CoA dehydrogenase family protein [Acidimicrobiia bacterium]|jgi:alkylation response protein AidB-like acyl-CoA dehydrogenase